MAETLHTQSSENCARDGSNMVSFNTAPELLILLNVL